MRTSEVAPGGTTTIDYLIDPNQAHAQVIEEWRSTGGAPTLAAAYAFGDDRLSQTRCLANTSGTPIGECNGGEASHYHPDGLGSTRLLSDGAGAVAARYAYSAFGELDDAASGGGTNNNYRFTGEQFDAELGFYYLRARYMDPSVGRFPTQDTWMGIGTDPITLHKFAYANDQPVTVRDPSGHFGITEVALAADVAGDN